MLTFCSRIRLHGTWECKSWIVGMGRSQIKNTFVISEKFAGQPIDTLADSRRWVMNGCRLLGSGLLCGGIFCRVLCGMKVAHNAQPRVENWWFWRQQLIVEFIWGRTKTVFGLINKIDRGIRADEIWNSNDFVSSFYCVFMKMLRYSKQMFLSFIKAQKLLITRI